MIVSQGVRFSVWPREPLTAEGDWLCWFHITRKAARDESAQVQQLEHADSRFQRPASAAAGTTYAFSSAFRGYRAYTVRQRAHCQ